MLPRHAPARHRRPSGRPLRRCVRPCCPGPGAMPPAGTPGHRRGCTGHRTDVQDRRSPTGAAWSGSPSTRASACSGVGHGAPVFTGDLLACQSQACELAAPLRHAAGSPGLGLLRGLRHARMPSADGEPARRTAGRATPGRFPRSLCAGRQGWCPAFPRQPRHGYAAGLPRGLLGRKGCDLRSRRTPCCTSAPGVRCCPAHIRQVRGRFAACGGSTTGSLHVAPSCLACRTRAVWQCRPVPSLSGLLPPSLAPPRPGCPQLQPGCCDSPAVGPFTPPGHTAPRGARPCQRGPCPAGCVAAQPASGSPGGPARLLGTWWCV
jgi:hypothetical protein